MKVSRVIAITNQKGGVGKTTTAINLGAALVKNGKKVLLIDFDPQSNLTKGLGWWEPQQLPRTITDIVEDLVNGEEFQPFEGILHHDEGMDVMPTNRKLVGFEANLINELGREYLLKRYIEMVRRMYDYILIDSQPSLNILTINVLTAANGIIIPTQPEMYSIEGIMEIKRIFQKIRQSNLNPALGIDGILVTMMNNQTNYTRQERDAIINELCLTDHVYEACIPYTVKLKECGKIGVSIIRHCPRNKAAAQYELLAKEVIANEQKRRESKDRFGQLVSFNAAGNKRKKGNRRVANQ